jgi:hypothetical protein
MDNKKKKAKSSNEDEILEILAKAELSTSQTLFLDDESELISEDEIKKLIPNDADNPNDKYNIYYKGIQKLLKMLLPKGKENKEYTDLVREEVNTFLTRGKRKKNGSRGADARMGYYTDMEKAFNVLSECVVSKGTMIDVYNAFRDMNIEMEGNENSSTDSSEE